MKAILLLHGFKRNDEDDFGQIHDFFLTLNADKVYNEVWFENYDVKTLNKKYFIWRSKDIAKKIKEDGITELNIVAYSSGIFLVPIIKKELSEIKVNTFSIATPLKIKFARWIPASINSYKMQKKLKKKMGKERYARLKDRAEATKTREKHPIKIMTFINKIRLKYRKDIINDKDIKYLISPTDEYMKTSATNKILSKRNRHITLTDFSHLEIMKSQKDIVIEWINKEMK